MIRGVPQRIRMDHGLEFTSSAFVQWCTTCGITVVYSQPRKPPRNAYVERYNRTTRHDWLSHYLFNSIAEVQDFATRWLWTYNHARPNMALGVFTPKQKMVMAA